MKNHGLTLAPGKAIAIPGAAIWAVLILAALGVLYVFDQLKINHQKGNAF